MRLVLAAPAGWPRDVAGAVTTYTVAPGVSLTVAGLEPLPVEVAGWGLRVVESNLPADRYRLLRVEELATDLGWPVTFARSDLLAHGSGPPLEHRLHALYRFLEYGGVAVLRSTELAALERTAAEVQPLLLRARPDFATEGLPALALVWAGLGDAPPPAADAAGDDPFA
jgi:hypothetical protein